MNIYNIISKVKPDYILNFAAQSHVKVSHDLENYTFQTNTLGILNILQSVRNLGLTNCRIYQASTSEQFGNETDGSTLLNENSQRNPVSIYGISKVAAENICNMYRDAYGMFIVNSTLFNHENARRGHTFVTQKIADYVGKYKNNKNNKNDNNKNDNNKNDNNNKNEQLRPLQLGNLNARRDWGYANDYMQGVYLMLMQETPKNYVIATGETHSVREFVELAFKNIEIDIEWNGSGKDETGVNKNTREILVQVNERYYRDIDIECLIGDSSKARSELGWEPKTSFPELVRIMVTAAINRNF
jgi:GDPmannose 4,6-dehydratase